MSESPEPVTSGAPAGPTRYQRSSGGLIGAMLVTVLAVFAFAAFRAITRDNEPTPVRGVDYAASVREAKADKQLLVLAPDRLPPGWTATSATYTSGGSPSWHLGTLTRDRRYVGVEESLSGIQSLVEQHVDVNADRGKNVTIDGETWQTWTDSGGDYAVIHTVEDRKGSPESVLVVGSASDDQVRELAESLTGH
jgi:hypothetical protein